MRIAYENVLTKSTSTITSSGDVATYEKENAYDNRTSDFWQATTTSGWLKSTSSGTDTVDYFCMYAHDMANTGTIVLQYSDNDSTWTNAFSPITPLDNTPIFETFTSSAHKYWRVLLAVSTVPNIGVITFGERVDMPFDLSVGFKPLALSQTRTVKDNISDSGEFLGRSLISRPIKGSLTFPSYFTETWMRTEWITLLAHIEQYPFFVMPQDNYATEIAFCWCNNIPTPRYRTQTHLSLTLPVMCKIS